MILASHCTDSRRNGFTLIELLIVLSILSAVAFIAVGVFHGASKEANDRLVLTEMQEIAKAIQRFKSDTGYYPKTGPFALDDTDGVPYANLPSYAGSNNTEKARWFYSPANFWQLLTATSPLKGTGRAVATWNVETGRGWRGPYLKGFEDGYLAIGDAINDGAKTGNISGDPLAGNKVTFVCGIADPFEHRPQGTLLGWTTTENGILRKQWGRPYLFLNLEGTGDPERMGLVSMGPDGELGTDDDIKLYVD